MAVSLNILSKQAISKSKNENSEFVTLRYKAMFPTSTFRTELKSQM